MKDKVIEWIDGGREPRNPSNPDFPNGIDLDVSDGISTTCRVLLPYPAKRVGTYLIECRTCGWNGIVTTAGRPDDPRSITIACLQTLQ